MSGPIRLFVGSYPEFYDRLLVPVLFAPYARILAERLRGMTVGNVLESRREHRLDNPSGPPGRRRPS
jgi:hypothetical protein